MESEVMIQELTENSQATKVWSIELTPDEVPLLDQISRLLGKGALQQLGVYQLPIDFKLSVAIPVYNERATICEIIRRVRAKPRHDVRYAGVHLSRPYPINVVSLSNKAA